MVRLVVDNDFRSLSEGEKVAGHRRLLKTVASLKDNDETDTITAPLFRIGRCGDARLVNWKEVSCLRVFFPFICYLYTHCSYFRALHSTRPYRRPNRATSVDASSVPTRDFRIGLREYHVIPPGNAIDASLSMLDVCVGLTDS